MPQTAALDDNYCPPPKIQKRIRLRHFRLRRKKGKAVDNFVHKFMNAMQIAAVSTDH